MRERHGQRDRDQAGGRGGGDQPKLDATVAAMHGVALGRVPMGHGGSAVVVEGLGSVFAAPPGGPQCVRASVASLKVGMEARWKRLLGHAERFLLLVQLPDGRQHAV